MSDMHDYGDQPLEGLQDYKTDPSKSGLVISSKFYDILKPVASLYFPLVVAFYGTLSQVWKWPVEVQVMATLAAVQVFLGGLLMVSAAAYKNSPAKYDGDIKVDANGMIRGLAPNTGKLASGAKDAVFKVTSL